LRRTKVGPIGLDFDESELRLLQLEQAGPAVRPVAAAAILHDGDLSPESPKKLRRSVRRALRANRFRGRKVVTAMPAADVKLMLVNYERGEDGAEAEPILEQVSQRLRQPLDDRVIDYLPLRVDPEREAIGSALVAIAAHERVISYLELLRYTGLEVEALEIAPVAVKRLIARSAQHRDNVLVISVGASKSYLMLLWGRRLLLYREVDFGIDRITERVSKALDVNDAEAASLVAQYGAWVSVPEGPEAEGGEVAGAITEIVAPAFSELAEQAGHALVYAASRTRGESVDCVHLLGSVGRCHGSERLLSTLLGVPALVLDPLAGSEHGVASPAESAQWALAAGLGLYGMPNDA
jgi:type IV pilus assembly protein PilM